MSKNAARDVDHEMAQLLKLAVEFQRPSRRYPEHVWSALRVADATHFRTFMEFVHSGQPKVRRDPDIRLADFVSSKNQRVIGWTHEEERRPRAADKLAAHLSTGRGRRRGARQEFGDLADHRLVMRRITLVMKSVTRAPTTFPKTAAFMNPLGRRAT